MLQDPDIIIHRLRLRYLSQIQDGIGERIIDFSQTKTNTTAFKIAGGDPALMDRCISPDIPTYDATESNATTQFRNGLVSPVPTQLSEDTETTGTLRRTITDLSLTAKRSRSNLAEDFVLGRLNPALRDDEASDQSDISEEDATGIHTYGSQQKHLFMMNLHKKIAAEPKFEKMPIRRRGISDASVSYRNTILPAARRPTFSISRNGSESDLSRNGGASQSIVNWGFIPLIPGTPYEAPVLGIPQPNTPDNVENFSDVLAAFNAAEDTSEDEYDIGDSSLTNLPDLLGTSFLDIQPSTTDRIQYATNQPSLGKIAKSKLRPESVFQPTSGLSALLKASRLKEVAPLEMRYGTLSGKGDLKPLKLKIYRPTSELSTKPFEVIIKSTATVLETIGYALLRYMEEKRQPPILAEQQDPNFWTLRIVEDDGELDEDFPALERTRPISKFSFDEFAIVEATVAQIQENQTLTPDALGIKTNLKTIPEVQLLPASGPSSLQVKPVATSMLTNENSLAVSTIAPSLASTAVVHTIRHNARAPGASVLLKVRLKPDPSTPAVLYAQSTVLDVTTETYLGDVLDQVCKRRNLDKYMFSLRLVGSNVVVPSDRTVESLQGRTELLLVRKKATDLLTDTVAPRSMTPNAPIVAVAGTYTGMKSSLGEASSLSAYMPDLVTSSTYQHWIVWRRQPMSFMGRHERILAIDGEYVHVSPSESKTMFESPKTSSIHVGQIVACKQSRKIPVNFKIMIIKAGQTKRYDFEATRPHEAETIVNRVKTLTRNWAARRSIRQSRMVM